MARTSLAQENFLLPNPTFIAELFAFVVILWVLARYVLPHINRAMTERQEAIRTQFAELEEAKANAQEAENEYRSQLADARHEAAAIRERAREEGATIVAEMREQARARSPTGSSGRPTRRSRPSVSRSSRSCARRWAQWRPRWRDASSESRSTTTSAGSAPSNGS